MSGNSGRDTAGRFASGNPGKRRGARNRATMAALSLMEGQSEALSCKAVQMALGGDTTALRLCLERLVPPVKDTPIQFDLPAMQCARDASESRQCCGEIKGRCTKTLIVLFHALRRTCGHTGTG